jgi:transcriptional regulator with PAS, ATPase and Fis domain
MSLEIQAKILRALQNKEIQRLGGDTVLKIDTRFIAATNKNIIQMIYDKTFRNDLYFRLNTTIFEIPPLRERREDIPLLINYFLNDTACDCVISENVLKLLMKYHWPGNIRELKNVIEYSAAICTNRNIKIEDLPHNLNSLNSSAFNPTPITNAEYNIIFNSLKRNKFNKKKTAEELGISRKTLYNKIEKFKIPTNGN